MGLDLRKKDNSFGSKRKKILSRLEITGDHHCGGEIFHNIFSHVAENILKNLSSTEMGSV